MSLVVIPAIAGDEANLNRMTRLRAPRYGGQGPYWRGAPSSSQISSDTWREFEVTIDVPSGETSNG